MDILLILFLYLKKRVYELFNEVAYTFYLDLVLFGYRTNI